MKITNEIKIVCQICEKEREPFLLGNNDSRSFWKIASVCPWCEKTEKPIDPEPIKITCSKCGVMRLHTWGDATVAPVCYNCDSEKAETPTEGRLIQVKDRSSFEGCYTVGKATGERSDCGRVEITDDEDSGPSFWDLWRYIGGEEWKR